MNSNIDIPIDYYNPAAFEITRLFHQENCFAMECCYKTYCNNLECIATKYKRRNQAVRDIYNLAKVDCDLEKIIFSNRNRDTILSNWDMMELLYQHLLNLYLSQD